MTSIYNRQPNAESKRNINHSVQMYERKKKARNKNTIFAITTLFKLLFERTLFPQFLNKENFYLKDLYR